jgi:A/G-specific adenine glycosylase
MLQQTQVATVVPYFERFLNTFPTIANLAAAEEQQVLRVWEGLGYYRRARALHRAAQHVMTEYGERLPEDPEQLRTLPGIGPYTLGAILSQAFDRRWPAVDANVARVLCRWFAWPDDPRAARSQAWLWETAEKLLPPQKVGEWNQALMELGALVCTPRLPRCRACPVRRHCAAHQRGLEDRLPGQRIAATTVRVQEVAVVLRRRHRVLLLQRPPDSERWAGMWEFPRGECRRGEPPRDAAERLVRELTGLRVELGPRLITIKHSVTHFSITIDCYVGRPVNRKLLTPHHIASRWCNAAQIENLPLAATQRTLAARALGKQRLAR